MIKGSFDQISFGTAMRIPSQPSQCPRRSRGRSRPTEPHASGTSLLPAHPWQSLCDSALSGSPSQDCGPFGHEGLLTSLNKC